MKKTFSLTGSARDRRKARRALVRQLAAQTGEVLSVRTPGAGAVIIETKDETARLAARKKARKHKKRLK